MESLIKSKSISDAEASGRDRLSVISEKELLTLQKPAQYLGGELNSIIKTDSDVDVHFALAFPDTYEVGMSHLGLQILYDVINREEKSWAERVFMPLPDMETLLRQTELGLYALESKRPIREFDILGFSLQYELCGTNILAMLDLAQIPLYSRDRADGVPIVIGGGPFSYHPEPLAPFFDAFFLGDAEHAVLDVTACVRQLKTELEIGSLPFAGYREELLRRLGRIEGIYVPAFFTTHYDANGNLAAVSPQPGHPDKITRRLLPTLNGAPYARKPIVPSIKTIHNRLSIEVMRGCVRGCRFCQAGYLYRPQRERSPQEILEMVQETLPQTGFEELSLLSLSTADYCSIVPLLKSLMDRYGDGDKLAISFPSTRVDALTPEVLEQVQRVRRTGFTVAPEAGTQRLRDVINKGVTDDQILETCRNVFSMGWSGIKLYFMLGLPTETDDDLRGIIEIASRIKALPEARGKDITVSVSTHVPKPHTPFQWAAQITPAETVRKQRLLADGLRPIKVNLRYHESFSSFLEGVFARGGRELAPTLVRAYELGCRLDAWTEHLSEELWTEAFLQTNINPLHYLRERSLEETLPWDHLSCGIPKEYFSKEFRRAVRAHETPDCLTQSCSICGACDYDTKRNVLWKREDSEALLSKTRGVSHEVIIPENPVMRLRLKYRKSGAFRFVGHLELVHVFHRAARRAGLPLAYSKGFHPMPRLAFGPPVQLGIESAEEYVDAFLNSRLEAELFREFLNQTLPTELQITEAAEISLSASSVQDSIHAQRFKVGFLTQPQGVLGAWLEQGRGQQNLLSVDSLRVDVAGLVVERYRESNRKKNREKRFALGEYISDLAYINTPNNLDLDGDLEFTLLFDTQRGSPKPTEVIKALSELDVGDYSLEKVFTFYKDEQPFKAVPQLL